MKYLDQNGLLYVWQKIKAMFVAKEDGKGLSANDYTTVEKEKLASIEAGATKVTIDESLDATSSNPVENKAVAVSLETKVDKVDGKGLSANDYTTPEKEKLQGIAENATRVLVDANLDNTSTNAVQNKVVNTALATKAPLASPALTGSPTAPTAEAGTNTTQIATTAFVNTAVTSAFGQITQISYSVVDELPATGETGVIYLIRHNHGSGDTFDEHIWIESSSSYEKIGNTDIDLSGYVTSASLSAITNTEIDTMIAS